MNSISGKFEQLKTVVQGIIDVLVITETKLDATFPDSQFFIEGYSTPYRLDRNRHGGGVLIYIREDIPNKKLSKHNCPADIEGLFIEINLRKTKWLIFGTYHPPNQSDQYYFDCVGRALDSYNAIYDKYLLIGDFNAEERETCMKEFLYQYDLQNLVKEKTCFKSISNPSCIDLFLTNHPKFFQNTMTISSGLSDFHKLIVTVLKTKFCKAQPKIMYYRNYKNFDKIAFRAKLRQQLENNKSSNYIDFENIFLSILEEQAPLKKKTIRANHAPYMTKALRKAIMRRSALENQYHKNKTPEHSAAYKKHKNFCSRLYKKERKKYYSNLNLNDITDNKKFWKTIKPMFSNKEQTGKKITLVNENEILSTEEEVSKKFNSFFQNAVKSLAIKENKFLLSDASGIDDPIDIALKKYEIHPSVLKINETISSSTFSLTEVFLTDIEDEINKLDTKKANTFKNIPPKILKENSDICNDTILRIVNNGIRTSNFPDELKSADVTPIFKKGDSTDVKNYRPVSVLPVMSKIFERILQKQINEYIDKFMSPYLCGFRKGYSTQHALLALIENWKTSLDQGGYAGSLLMDLSKAFDTLNHDLLLAKLHAYGFDKNALEMINSYLSNRWQRTKINTTFSTWTELLLGVPQGSVLGPLLFNIYINDLFFINDSTEACNYADDTTFYKCHRDPNYLIKSLEHDASLAIEWFECNYMKLNESKCHFIIAGNRYEHLWAKVGQATISEQHTVKLLGVEIDDRLSFTDHVTSLCVKAGRKLTALTRISNLISTEKRRILINSFIDSQFNYCKLVWMFYSRKLNNKINRLQERSLRIIYDDDDSSFEELLRKDGSVTIHHRNIQALATEMFKVKHNLSPKIIIDMFQFRNNISNTRNNHEFFVPRAKTVSYGSESIKHLGPKIWNTLPNVLKDSCTLNEFKEKVKTWVPVDCPCKLCRVYVPNLGYI